MTATALSDAVRAHLNALGELNHRTGADGTCWPECVACSAERLAAAKAELDTRRQARP